MKRKIVQINWEDTGSNKGWIKDHRTATSFPVETVGFLVHADKKCIKLAQSDCDDGTMGEIIVIPRGVIRRYRRLR